MCHNEKKGARRMASMTSDASDTSNEQQQAQRNKNTRGRGLFHQSITVILAECVCVCACFVSVCLCWSAGVRNDDLAQEETITATDTRSNCGNVTHQSYSIMLQLGMIE